MNSKYNNLAIKLLTGMTMAALALPQLAAAQSSVKERRAANPDDTYICSRLQTSYDTVVKRMTEREEAFKSRRDEKKDRLEERRDDLSDRLEERREASTERREAHYLKIAERASTTEQKLALVEFQKAVESAVTARKAAVDAANKKFQNDLHALIESTKTEANAAVTAYRNAVKAAFEKALTDCKSGTAISEVRSTLEASLRSARDNYLEDKREIEKLRGKVKDLNETRKAAVKEALNVFKSALEKAKADLKAAWGA